MSKCVLCVYFAKMHQSNADRRNPAKTVEEFKTAAGSTLFGGFVDSFDSDSFQQPFHPICYAVFATTCKRERAFDKIDVLKVIQM